MLLNPCSMVIYRKELPSIRAKPLEPRALPRSSHKWHFPLLACARLAALAAVVFLTSEQPLAAAEEPADMSVCLETMGSKAEARGVPKPELDRTLASIQAVPRVLELEKRQPEFTLTFGRYLSRLVTEERVVQGQALLEKHGKLLREVGAKYGVQPRFLVAFWGLETNFGGNLGSFQTLDALATLACQGRRREFFGEQFLDALKIVGNGEIAADSMIGSWAGAMGQVQFIPSTFQAYAVDHDGDGRRDLWGSLPDAFASAANFLSQIGWTDQRTWGREVRLPEGFDWRLLSIETKPETVKSLAEWAALGVRKADGSPLPRVAVDGAVIAPAGHQGPAFMVYGNYNRILDWNRSILYAVAVGHLSDRLIGKPPLVKTTDPKLGRLSTGEVQELQRRLNQLGYGVGEPDGRIGPRTRAAIRNFQMGKNRPADGFADRGLLRVLRESTQG